MMARTPTEQSKAERSIEKYICLARHRTQPLQLAFSDVNIPPPPHFVMTKKCGKFGNKHFVKIIRWSRSSF